ncbi:hypothetical protein HB825_05430 [Listeria booriae]|uniref:hypothetical protein n=1 Tax=Listeria booriae TaxID=1552123 RepID=UPI00162AD74C|nr:hypothetical protein [Listeria booriae]MBC1524923.1 hypothetical protein [Listeria booriae]MBC6134278.1 hypothetical protein [Listeria booriae]
MSKIIINFSDSTSLTLTNDDTLTTLSKIDNVAVDTTTKDKDVFPKVPSISQVLKLHEHHHDGLIPSLLEIVINYDFFMLNDDNKKVYCSNAIVSIESI